MPKFDARPDTLDFRDLMYTPTLVEVPTSRRLADYRKARVPILDQGQEGACTGFGLATVVHYLLRARKRVPDERPSAPTCCTTWRAATTNGPARITRDRAAVAR